MCRYKCDEYTDCKYCDCWDSDREGCTMPSIDMAYACSMEQDTESEYNEDLE